MKFNGGSLVCLTGIDGSGKTTHAKSLIRFLSEEGYTTVYVWAASRPILSLSFFGVTRVLGYWKATKKGMYTDPLEFAPPKVRSKLGSIWRLLQFIDFHMKMLVTVKAYLARGIVVICDRYVYDMIMEFKVSNLSTPLFESLLLRTAPAPAVTFLLDISERTARSRRTIPLEQLSIRRAAFLRMAEKLNFVVIDASKDFGFNREKIQAETLSRLQLK